MRSASRSCSGWPNEPWPENVRVVDFGIRGFDLTMALLEDLDLVILVDAAPRGGPPGTLYVIEPESDEKGRACARRSAMLDPHSLDPVKVLRAGDNHGGPARARARGRLRARNHRL